MDDLISRQAAIDAVFAWYEDYKTNGINVKKPLVDWLKNLPSTQPERKKGKWIAHNNLMYSPFDGSNENTCICNQCEAEAEKATNYCPSCGADMREKENE